ncbi:MAG: ROK family protein, partial [Rhodothermales bacterium]
DVGGSGIKGAPVDVDTGEMTAERVRVKPPDKARPEAVAEIVAEIVRHFDWKGPVGCAFPARIKNGVAKTAANIDQAWLGTNVAELFSQASGCPFLIINDADAAGMAEMAFGVGRGRKDIVLLLTVGTGIGSALFHKGVLLPNTEFGHFILHGMVAEHYASDKARKEHKLNWAQWAKRAQDYLSHLERLFDLDLIILGGGISKPKKVEKYFHLLKTQAELLTASLQNEAGIVGAACSAHLLSGVT